jgi:hypothetical protein
VPVLEVVVWLALHTDRRYSAEQISTELGRGRERDRDPATIRRYINEIRRALGEDAVPEGRSAGGFQLIGVGTDVARFDAEIEVANKASSEEDRAQHLAKALSLVRGIPFATRPGGAYGWTDAGEQLSRVLANRAVTVATQFAHMALEQSDSTLGRWAARQGLLASPTEESLDRLLLDAASFASLVQLDHTWKGILGRLAAEAAEPTPTLVAHYEELRRANVTKPN